MKLAKKGQKSINSFFMFGAGVVLLIPLIDIWSGVRDSMFETITNPWIRFFVTLLPTFYVIGLLFMLVKGLRGSQ